MCSLCASGTLATARVSAYNPFVHQFVRDLITEWRRLELPFDDATVVVAVSGGADSVSLLVAMHDLVERSKLSIRLVAAHFNHKLRGAASDHDEEYVRRLATRLKIELAVKSARSIEPNNIEEKARLQRYEFLADTANNLGAFAVVTAHTMNDQAETFLMSLLRGSGPSGLGGMKTVRELAGDVKLIRPLLTWAKRSHTEGFCRDLGIEYCYDTMNEDTAFKRVRIRKILLPLLADLNPNIVETLANTAALMQKCVETARTRNQFDPGGELLIGDLRSLSEGERLGAIRGWIKERRGNTRQLGLKHIQSIERLALSTKSGRTAEVPGGKVVKTDGRLVFEENRVEKKGADL